MTRFSSLLISIVVVLFHHPGFSGSGIEQLRDTIRVRFQVDMTRAVQTLGFGPGDTLLVRSEYFGTGAEIREKRMIRVGTTLDYTAINTVASCLTARWITSITS